MAAFSHIQSERELLEHAERVLADIGGLLASPLGRDTGGAEILQETIRETAAFLGSTEHRIAYLGPAGVGKTTLLSYQAGLVQARRRGRGRNPLQDPVLTVGPGSTTLCEIALRQAERATVAIEPLPPEEFEGVVRDFCSDAWDAAGAGCEPVPTDVTLTMSAELDRALRNMAGLTCLAADADPAVDLARAHVGTGFETFVAAVQSRIGPERRTAMRLACPDGLPTKRATLWLRNTLRDVNDGRIAEVPLPRRLLVEAPMVGASVPGFGIEFVDTMGISGTALRADLLNILQDPRCVPVLCASFGNAPPGPALLHLLNHAAELGMAEAIQRRAVLLALTRGNEARYVRDPATGEAVGDPAKGRDLKAREAQHQLHRIGMGALDVVVFDIARDDCGELGLRLQARIQAERRHHAEVLAHAIDAATALVQADPDAGRAEAAALCAGTLDRFAARFAGLAPRVRQVEGEVVRSVRSAHPQRVRATVRRQGRWQNLDIPFLIAAGAAAEAGVRSAAARAALLESIEQLRADPTARPLAGVMAALASRLPRWTAAFLEGAGMAARQVFESRLTGDVALWARCGQHRGRGYVAEVAGDFGCWFADNDRRLLQRALDVRLQQLWDASVVARVKAVVAQLRSAPPAAVPLSLPSDPRLALDTACYRAFTREFDQEVRATDLVGEDELARLRAQLEVAASTVAGPGGAFFGLRGAAVTFLVDHSGSMRGQPMRMAAALVRRAADALHAMGAAVEVLGFTTRAWKGGWTREAWLAQGRPRFPGRLNDLRHIVYHAGTDPWSDAGRAALGAMLHEGWLKENIDGEALAWAYRRSLALPAARRCIVVFSDGAPVDDSTLAVNPDNYLEQHLRGVVGAVEEQRLVGLGAVGIGREVGDYYRARILCTGPEDLDVTRLLDLVGSILLPSPI
jgi:hypothetical protein